MTFAVDPAFDAGSIAAAETPLCRVRLQDDARFPWLILIPRGEGLVELEDLDATSRAVLMNEILRASDVVRALGELAGKRVEKLNVGTLGNVTRQLHVHVIGRRRDDPLWPDPVWGRGAAEPYIAALRERALQCVRSADWG